MTEKRRKFLPQEKVVILRRHLVERVALSSLCDEYQISPTIFYRWQKEFFEKGSTAFERQKDAVPSKVKKRVAHLEAQLSHKNEVIAEIMEAHVQLKKSLGEI